MLKEIVSLNGKPFQIWYETPYDRANALAEAEGQCATCGDRGLGTGIESLAATCTATTKTVGQTITLSSVPTSGTPPYKYSFYKMVPGSATATWLLGTATLGQSLSSYTYTTVAADITNINGQLKVGVLVFDSCATGVKISDESCYVNVVAACGTPAANLTVT